MQAAFCTQTLCVSNLFSGNRSALNGQMHFRHVICSNAGESKAAAASEMETISVRIAGNEIELEKKPSDIAREGFLRAEVASRRRRLIYNGPSAGGHFIIIIIKCPTPIESAAAPSSRPTASIRPNAEANV